ncbi:MAG: 2-C-methyl-D-erythritol 2,4-cyclodiphosphate synthase [Gammaproteobacteria bacterium]|nr:2-C-methyl-D-erythritol 2,4-cyclodiphosphate synthase [Gammaproteobacteria bacterium]
MRIGHGFDAHRFATGAALVLGGVRIDHPQGMEAHSDGDVVIHALCDALLGAAGLGDIGQHFPDADPQYRGIDSRILLRAVMAKIRGRQLQLSNADITIVAQSPRLAPYRSRMTQVLAEDIGVDTSRLNIKATTTEGMGFTGRNEGIAVHAVVLLSE